MAQILTSLHQATPNDTNLSFKLGILMLKMNKLDEAEESFNSILNLLPDNSNTMWFLASVYELKGDLSQLFLADVPAFY